MNYIKISKYDTSNGTGVGVVLWVAGCSCHCKNCHNPQTWNFDAGTPFTEETMQELIENLNKPYISRITYSGGHPLERQNIKAISEITSEIRRRYPDKSQWLYTGYTWEFLMGTLLDRTTETNIYNISIHQYYYYILEVLNNIDILVDGEYIDELRDISLPFRGSSNQRIIEVKKSLELNKIILWQEQIN